MVKQTKHNMKGIGMRSKKTNKQSTMPT